MQSDAAELLLLKIGAVTAEPDFFNTVYIGVHGDARRCRWQNRTPGSRFSNRTAGYNLGLSAGWVDGADDDATVAASQAWLERVKPFSDGTVYLN